MLSLLDDAWGNYNSQNQNSSNSSSQNSTTIEEEIDGKFVTLLHQNFSSHPFYLRPKFASDNQFILKHYAGDVRYTCNGTWVSSNVETLTNELKSLGNQSSLQLVREVFAHGLSNSSSGDGKPMAIASNKKQQRSLIRGVSIGSQFKSSLNSLVQKLNQMEPHYVRCIKPNLAKLPQVMDCGEVLRQLKYSGMFEAVRIRQQGYALRMEHESFLKTYGILSMKDSLAGLITALTSELKLTSEEWQIGHTKIFLKTQLMEQLNMMVNLKIRYSVRRLQRFGRKVAEERCGRLITAWAKLRLVLRRKRKRRLACVTIQKVWRGYLEWKQFQIYVTSVICVQSLWRKYRAVQIADKLRHPYRDLTYEELLELESKWQSDLDACVKKAQFDAAGKLEQKLVPLREAIIANKPLTREIIDETCAQLESQLEELLQNKEYEACSSVKQKLDDWLLKKKDFPTEEELQEEKMVLEDKLEDCIAKKSYQDAEKLRKELDTIMVKLQLFCKDEEEALQKEEILEEENEQKEFESRVQLEKRIEEIEFKLAECVTQKNYIAAEEFQIELDRFILLRKDYPSRDDFMKEVLFLSFKCTDSLAAHIIFLFV